VRKAASDTLQEYSVGSCGPRGFYGTTLKHLELESALAAFMGTPEAITYSDATAATTSAIPAFAKRGDFLLVDGGVNHAVLTVSLPCNIVDVCNCLVVDWIQGSKLSRGKIVFFAHNNMDHLEQILQEQQKWVLPIEWFTLSNNWAFISDTTGPSGMTAKINDGLL